MDKLVFVKEIGSGTTRNGKQYPIIKDQDNDTWHYWGGEICPVELHKSYLFTFKVNDAGYKDIEKISPLVNIFKQEALKEVASRNDIIRNLTVCLSYAKDMVIGKAIDMDIMYDMAFEMYQRINDKADELMPKVDEP